MAIHPSPSDMPGVKTAAHAPARPVPDGRLVVTTVDGVPHEFPYGLKQGWRALDHYLSVPTASGRKNFPWSQILHFETFGNSAEYVRLRAEYSIWENAQKAQEARDADE